MTFTIHAMKPEDWKQVREIYREGLATGLAAFATKPPRWKTWDEGHLTVGRFVACMEDGAIAGWSALAPVPDT